MSFKNPRLELTDRWLDAVIKFSDGNIGAVSALTEMAIAHKTVDPDDAFGPFGILMNMDNLDIYGPKIWILYNDVCQRSAAKSIALLRAVQLGVIKESELVRAIDSIRECAGNPITTERIDEIVELVKQYLPRFTISA